MYLACCMHVLNRYIITDEVYYNSCMKFNELNISYDSITEPVTF